MILDWWKRRTRQRLTATPAPSDWPDLLAQCLPWYAYWRPEVQAKLMDDLRIFMAEKHWEGCEGLTITQPMQVTVAAHAAMMLMGVRDYYFDAVQTILMYPASFYREVNDGPVVGRTARIGEAWHRGPIVLSWRDVMSPAAGRNLVVHELAHHLDGLDGEVSGNPLLPSAQAQSDWNRIAASALAELQASLRQGDWTALDPYAATNRAEFFAVSCEVFFSRPARLRNWRPDLYQALSGFFHIDPASWGAEPNA